MGSIGRRVDRLEHDLRASPTPQGPPQRFPSGPTWAEICALDAYIEHLEAGGEPDEELERTFEELANRPISPEAESVMRQIEALGRIDDGRP